MHLGSFRRIYNWGPLTALGIIKTITLVTVHCSRQWWPLYGGIWMDTSFLTFFFLSGSTLYHLACSIFIGPGYLPLRWSPANVSDNEWLQYCFVCQGYKAPRSHHCRKCGRCVLKMDHHCPWINNCVGHHNHGHFAAFLMSAVSGCCVSTYILIAWIITILSARPLPFSPPSIIIMIIVLFGIGLSIGVVLAVGMLLYFQIIAIVLNETGIESWILKKANYRRRGTKDIFVHPYSKSFLHNINQVISWHCTPPTDGIIWPVADGYDQYTLTREQLAQKLEKRKRSKKYRIISKATGSWVPISHGCQVLCSPPLTDEPRIKLDVDDTIIVTRWRTHWLFGEKENQERNCDKNIRIRGWIPAPCALEIIENQSEANHPKSD